MFLYISLFFKFILRIVCWNAFRSLRPVFMLYPLRNHVFVFIISCLLLYYTIKLTFSLQKMTSIYCEDLYDLYLLIALL